MSFRAAAVALVACGALLSRAAAAQPVDSERRRDAAERLGERRTSAEYWLHGGLTAAGIGASLLVTELSREHGARWQMTGFGPDDAVWANFNRSAARTSDVIGVFTLALPLGALLLQGLDTSLANASLIYAETQAANLFLVSVTKEIVRRPRPYTHSDSPSAQRFARQQGSEAYVSFYSGHASTAYSAAVAGSLLFAARTRQLWARNSMWGVELLLAGTTAQLRVRAGRHYRTDIWTGTAVGIGLGFAGPALHGVTPRLHASELGIAGGALLLTLLGEELFNPCSVLGCAESDADAALEHASSPSDANSWAWTVLPFVSGQGVGLLLSSPW